MWRYHSQALEEISPRTKNSALHLHMVAFTCIDSSNVAIAPPTTGQRSGELQLSKKKKSRCGDITPKHWKRYPHALRIVLYACTWLHSLVLTLETYILMLQYAVHEHMRSVHVLYNAFPILYITSSTSEVLGAHPPT